MSEGQLSKINSLHSLLDHQKPFSQINILQKQLSRGKKSNRLKKITKMPSNQTLKNKGINKKLVSPNYTLRSQMTKKSRTFDKESGKKIKSCKKISQKNIFQNSRKRYETLQFRPKETKFKSHKSIKNTKGKKQNSQIKWVTENEKKKKSKGDIIVQAPKSERGLKVVKIKSPAQFNNIENIMSTKKKKDLKQSNLIHDYFGSQQKISSIVPQKGNNQKRNNRLNMSKCKTHSSSNFSIKSTHKLVYKGINKKKK